LTVIVDANLLVVLALDDERAPIVETKLREWAAAGETLHAPALMPYEAANALVRASVARPLGSATIAEVWATISAVPVTLHPLREGIEVIAIAAARPSERLRRGVCRTREVSRRGPVDIRRTSCAERARRQPAGTSARMSQRVPMKVPAEDSGNKRRAALITTP
jgi:predicted nucleic acid-binding protein